VEQSSIRRKTRSRIETRSWARSKNTALPDMRRKTTFG